MLGMIAAVTLLASVDDQLLLPAAPLGVPEQHWSGRAAGAGALGVVGADLAAVVAGVALSRVLPVNCSNQETLCINETAALVTVLGLIVLPPTLALLLAQNDWDGRAVSLTLLAQGAAIACFAASSGFSSNSTAGIAFIASGMAFHFVGIPLAAGLVTTRPSREEASAGVAPTLGLALRW